MVDVSKSQRRTAPMEGQHQGIDWPVDVIIASDPGRQKLMGSDYSGGICRSRLTPTTPRRHRNYLVTLSYHPKPAQVSGKRWVFKFFGQNAAAICHMVHRPASSLSSFITKWGSRIYISRTVWPRITKFYGILHILLFYNHTGLTFEKGRKWRIRRLQPSITKIDTYIRPGWDETWNLLCRTAKLLKIAA